MVLFHLLCIPSQLPFLRYPFVHQCKMSISQNDSAIIKDSLKNDIQNNFSIKNLIKIDTIIQQKNEIKVIENNLINMEFNNTIEETDM